MLRPRAHQTCRKHDACLPPACAAAIQYVLDIATKVAAILEGSPTIDPMQFGWTTEEERSSASGSNVSLPHQPADALDDKQAAGLPH